MSLSPEEEEESCPGQGVIHPSSGLGTGRPYSWEEERAGPSIYGRTLHSVYFNRSHPGVNR